MFKHEDGTPISRKRTESSLDYYLAVPTSEAEIGHLSESKISILFNRSDDNFGSGPVV